MKIALSTDHAGFEHLQKLKIWLESHGYECINFGPTELDPTDDYPELIKPAAQAVSAGECELGIIFGSSGQGEAMVANRFKGVRCAVFYGSVEAAGAVDADGNQATDKYEILRLTRRHNHANMLSVGARFMSFEEAVEAVTVWLSTETSDTERHVRRVNEIDQV